MVILPKNSSTASIALHLSTDTVEAIVPSRGRGGPAHRLIRFSHDLELGQQLAEFIVRELSARSVPKRPMVLSLAPDIASPRILELPALPTRDLETIMARRAAALVDLEPRDVAFSAIALDGEDLEERRWLVHATARAPLARMQEAFRDMGRTVKRTIPGRTAPFLSQRCVEAASDEGATLVALFERDHCAIGLLSGGRIVHLSGIRGSAQDYVKGSPNFNSFIQELRGIDAFWRRASRGESVSAVIVGGLKSSHLAHFEPAIRGGLGDVRIALFDRGAEIAFSCDEALYSEIDLSGESKPDKALLGDPHDEARIQLLGTLLSSRAAVLDLGVELRPRARSLMAVGAVSALAFGAMALSVRSDLQAREIDLRRRTAEVQGTVVDLPRLQALEREVIALESEVRAACDELRAASAAGISIHDLAQGVLASFGPGLDLLSASAVAPIPAQNQDGVLRLRGTVQDEPGATAAALDDLEHRLASLPGVAGAHVELPSLADRGLGGSGPSSPLKFSAVLTLRAMDWGSDS